MVHHESYDLKGGYVMSPMVHRDVKGGYVQGEYVMSMRRNVPLCPQPHLILAEVSL